LSLPSPLRDRVAPAMWKEYFAPYFHPEKYPWTQRVSRTLQYWLVCLFFHGFPLPQTEAGAGQSMRYAGELVDDGWSLLVFPEGERNPQDTILPFYPGVAMMAERLRVPVAPVRIRGLNRVLPPGAWIPRPGKVEIRFGPPQAFAHGDYLAVAKQIEAAVASL